MQFARRGFPHRAKCVSPIIIRGQPFFVIETEAGLIYLLDAVAEPIFFDTLWIIANRDLRRACRIRGEPPSPSRYPGGTDAKN